MVIVELMSYKYQGAFRTLKLMKTAMRILPDNERYFKSLIISVLKYMGKDFKHCELCNEEITGRYNMHHTKYDFATIYDIKIVCRSCDKKLENKNLI